MCLLKVTGSAKAHADHAPAKAVNETAITRVSDLA